MIRDTRRSSAYFEKYIAEEEAGFQKMHYMALQKADEGNEKAAKRAYTFASGLQKNKMIAMYSAGEKLSDVKNAFEKWVGICDKLIQMPYYDLLSVASLCILLKPKEETVNIATRLLSDFSGVDMLIEGFWSYLLGKGFTYTSSVIQFDTDTKLAQVLMEPDKEKQATKLVSYVSHEWYAAQSDCAWYDSHLKDSDTYFGYWCFEGAALAVALSLNTSELLKIEYMPSDLL